MQDHISLNADKRKAVSKNGLTVLLYWGIVNVAAGGAVRLLPFTGADSFWEMMALWNVVNVALALSGLRGIRREADSRSIAEEVRKAHRFEKILLFNAGLDVAYMVFGLLLISLQTGVFYESYAGWGAAILIQGAFLLIFDIALAFRSSRVRDYELALTAHPR
ncbi:MAG: hypothetical protein EA383_03780 [Spirochaetaceae bacterium]|nr:MAG: hypothetical protein EA383_03780 [Spirochaetaceae bacterium]